MPHLLPADCPSNDCLEVGSFLLTVTPKGLAALRRLHAEAINFLLAHGTGCGHVSLPLPDGVSFTAHGDAFEDEEHHDSAVPAGFEPAGEPYRTELHRFDVFGGGTCYLTASPRDRTAYRIEANVEGLLFGPGTPARPSPGAPATDPASTEPPASLRTADDLCAAVATLPEAQLRALVRDLACCWWEDYDGNLDPDKQLDSEHLNLVSRLLGVAGLAPGDLPA